MNEHPSLAEHEMGVKPGAWDSVRTWMLAMAGFVVVVLVLGLAGGWVMEHLKA